MSKYGIGADIVRGRPDFFPRFDVAHDPERSFFVECAELFGYDAYATALPVLAATLAHLDARDFTDRDPVVEFGGGFASTPLLAAMCAVGGRRFVSFEADAAWEPVVAWGGAEVRTLDPGAARAALQALYDVSCEGRVALVLVDGEQAARGELVRTILEDGIAEAVVAHDWDPERDLSGYGGVIREILPGRVAQFRRLYPWTLLFSGDPRIVGTVAAAAGGDVDFKEVRNE